MKYFLIMNPRSNGGKSQKKFDRIFALLKQAKVNYEYRFVYTLNEAYDKSVEANRKAYDIIVAVGGDGTINGVINGFYNNMGDRISDAKFAVVYTGTSPDFCKSYDIPIHVDHSVETLLNAKTRRIPIGKLICCDQDTAVMKATDCNCTNTITKYFACCANIGIGASIARRANSGIRKVLGDFMGTFISLLISIIKYKANTFAIHYDGKKTHVNRLFNLSVGITKYIASGIKVAHTLNDKNGQFYCLETKKLNLFNTPGTLKKVYSGKAIKPSRTLSLSYAKFIEIEDNPINSEIEIDGDPVGYLPCKIEAANAHLELIC